MKRLALIAIACLAFICVGGGIAAFILVQAGASPGKLPLYPGAQNVQRGQPRVIVNQITTVRLSNSQGSGVVQLSNTTSGSVHPGPTLQFETTAGAQSV